jgi:hypothetical protein
VKRVEEQLRSLRTTALAAPEPVEALRARIERHRRRKRGLLGAGLLASLLAGAGAVAVLTSGDTSGRHLAIVTPVIARNAAARASVELPAGWHDLPTVETADPVQLLVVGTASRPNEEPITPCDAANPLPPGAGFVSIYEYVTGARLNSPDHTTVYDAVQFLSRPPDFAAVAPASSSVCDSATVPSVSTSDVSASSMAPLTAPSIVVAPQGSGPDHIDDYTFLDSGRFFVARVVTSGDPDGTRLTEAISVLNALEIAVPPDVTSTTSPGTTQTTAVSTDAQAVAREQITDDLRGAFGGGGPVSGDEAIVGGFPLGAGAKQAAKVGHESFIGFIVPRIDWLTVDSPTHAIVNFDLLIDGQVITANTTGEAVYIDGRWKLTEESFCTVVRRGGPTCPAR